MGKEITWERVGYESRIDAVADDISTFVAAVLASIDEDAARASPVCWDTVCRYFAGSAAAARAQGTTPGQGGKRIAAYLTAAFPCASGGSNAGFDEFMDWLSNHGAFRPSGLRSLLVNS